MPRTALTVIAGPSSPSLVTALMTSHLAQPSSGLRRKRTKYSLSAMSQLPWKHSGLGRDGEHRVVGEELTGDPNGSASHLHWAIFKFLLP